MKQALRVGIGGPVGSGKTALTLALCQALRDKYNIAAVTNDIYTEEDAQFLVKNAALAPERIIGVETGGCPTRRFARMPRSTSKPSTGSMRAFRGWRSCSSKAAATTSPPPSAPNCPTSRST